MSRTNCIVTVKQHLIKQTRANNQRHRSTSSSAAGWVRTWSPAAAAAALALAAVAAVCRGCATVAELAAAEVVGAHCAPCLATALLGGGEDEGGGGEEEG